jgi:RimJ/RimL family protein N-acetyltransferase
MAGVFIPELETERLRLRPWLETDLEPYAEFCASENTARFVGGACGREDAWRRIAMFLGHWTLRGYGPWALEEKGHKRWVGYAGLWNPHGWLEPEIMWGLAATAQGRGLATEAAQGARGYAYRQLGWRTAISCIAQQNRPSQKVAARLGATLEKTAEVRGHLVGIYRHPGPKEAMQT